MTIINNPRDAELLAAEFMTFNLGFSDAQALPTGPDGGVDIRSSGALAQVKCRAGQTGRPDLQRLYGARGTDLSKQLLFFSASGYSRHAIDYADDHQICLFTYDLWGEVLSTNGAAASLVQSASSDSVLGGSQAALLDSRSQARSKTGVDPATIISILIIIAGAGVGLFAILVLVVGI